MSYFADADDLYATLGAMLEEVLSDEELGPLFSRADCVIRWVCSDPDAEITVRLEHGREPRIDFGPSPLVPDVTMRMAADVAHGFWLGKVNVALALTRGQIVASGPVDRILRFVPLASRAFPVYHRLLAERGRSESLPDAAVA